VRIEIGLRSWVSLSSIWGSLKVLGYSSLLVGSTPFVGFDESVDVLLQRSVQIEHNLTMRVDAFNLWRSRKSQ
jgi:hypothetical protein